ncbi:YolD-like family protein [Kyrpidia spormannii]|uniref:Uncharacterized protein n=1 Tax=Kyrpidia spormannii TaxID=2055160 RepID=A0A6F9E3C1_9BACL|nr:YolD-like family protein [Kyrpidia spormannii]CAB3390890.1 conserved protein of unknown function [Kyrpidia spormannii]
MRITEGNLFSAMRLVLPEHRDMAERMEREANRRWEPKLTEDQLAELQ